MVKTMSVMAFALCVSVGANAADVNFNQNIDVKAVISDIHAAPGFSVPLPKYINSQTWTSDSGSVWISPSMSPVNTVNLSIREEIKECHQEPVQILVPNYCPPPVGPGHGGPGGPGHGGHGGPGGHHRDVVLYGNYNSYHNGGGYGCGYHYETRYETRCSTYYGATMNKQSVVTVNRNPQEMLPWESDNFTVTLNGYGMNIQQPGNPAFAYSTNRVGDNFNINIGNKVASAPDRNGIAVGAFSVSGTKFSLALSDKWSAYYQGEKIRIHVELYKEKGGSDSLFDIRDLEFDTAPSYEIGFKDVEKTGMFYATVKFTRIGNVSTQQQMDMGRTQSIPKDY